MNVDIEKSWQDLLQEEFEKPYFTNLVAFLKEEFKNHIIYPPGKLIFNAFNLCPFQNVKVVIVGQDPYHGEKQANGLCFSVSEEVPIPPSLRNIFKELKMDLDKPMPKSGDLTHWASQGILMLNTILTVRKSSPRSHASKGWETFTHMIIKKISDLKENVVFILWGNYAKSKSVLIDSKKHLVLKAGHPSPLSPKHLFFNKNHFSLTNRYLSDTNQKNIEW